MKKTFVMSDDSLNTHGFRVLTSGIDLSDFTKNPVCFFNHDTWGLPIAKWENIRVENGQLLGDCLFDENDPKAVEIWQKVENGFINSCSIGFRVLAVSSDPKDLAKGQQYETVTKCALRECSIVNIPANKNAVRLYDAYDTVMLSADSPNIDILIPKVKTILKMEKLKTHFNLAEADGEDKILSEIKAIQTENATLQKELADLKKDQITKEIVTLAEKKGIVKTQIQSYVILAETNLEAVKTILNEMTDYVPASAQLGGQVLSGVAKKLNDRKEWSFSEWQQKDTGGLAELKANFPAEYEELKKTLKNR